MMRSGWTSGLGMMGLALLGVWSCSGDAEDTPSENAAGSAGAAGHHEGGSDAGVGGGAAGDGGIAGAGGSGGDVCEAKTVHDYCAALESRVVPQACPEDANDFDLGREHCGWDRGVKRYASDCGGVVIEVWGDKKDGASYYSNYYSFDGQGELVGVSVATDAVHECPSVWGAPCAQVGDPESLCGAGGEGGAGGAGGVGGAGGGAGVGGEGGVGG